MSGARDEPLKDEAARRDEWRDDDPSRPSGEGSPASEDADERLKPSEDRTGPPGVVPPPD